MIVYSKVTIGHFDAYVKGMGADHFVPHPFKLEAVKDTLTKIGFL